MTETAHSEWPESTAFPFAGDKYRGYNVCGNRIELRAIAPRSFPFDRVYELIREDEGDVALDLIHETIDQALREGDFEAVDEWCKEIDVAQLDSHAMVAWLIATLPAAGSLTNRWRVLAKVEMALAASRTIEDVDRLLRSLR